MFIDGNSLSVRNLAYMARTDERIEIGAECYAKMDSSRALLESRIARDEIIYGVNTSLGGFVRWLVPTSQANQLQMNLISAVASNCGNPFAPEVVRASMIARVNSLVRGHSAIRSSQVQSYVDLINAGVVPFVPEKGSLGASGDLGPLAAVALVSCGKWKAFFNGELKPTEVGLKELNLLPLVLDYKEGLALINGTSFMAALGALVVDDFDHLLKTYDLISCLSIEALKGRRKPFHPSAHRAKNHKGQIRTASLIYNILKTSRMAVDEDLVSLRLRKQLTHTAVEGDLPIEDSYSVRCTPQILGPLKDHLSHVRDIVENELNSSNDNPLVFCDNDLIVHNGNFHGQYISSSMDLLSQSIVTLCNLSDRRIDRFLDANNSNGLPAFLCRENPGLRLGLMGGQFLATSLTAEVRSLCTPLSIQTLTSTGDFQDHVSMGLIAARRASQILESAHLIASFELICACQAAEIRGTTDLSRETRIIFDTVRQSVPYLDTDTPMTNIIESVSTLIKNRTILDNIEREIGAIESYYSSEH
ncbi:phenylalanine aminomutase (D-beta-phenylalanine forming) (plasmid) [Roseibium aggregatum]|uniref:aromatic amino acid lyase n=1 Tax=Roseibium aggregatum TaxID=187304 RepID=UPI001E503252|nr:aromatic amino acid lyase [Roseibium aggregatum]UES60168.1 phenylalanine aminomutase (D-beta-phenylalanine forming) [Roseibium aggregatum]UES60279.1 phenylalanine aminomutase (D-beta-phenylalanine forming) [Roseibium aggregatum]